MSLGSGLWVPVSLTPSLQYLFENFTDVTLADDDTNSILADDVGWEVNKLATELAKWCRSCMEYWSSHLCSCWQQYGLLGHWGGDGC